MEWVCPVSPDSFKFGDLPFFLNESLCLLNVGKLRLLKELIHPTYDGCSVAEKEYN